MDATAKDGEAFKQKVDHYVSHTVLPDSVHKKIYTKEEKPGKTNETLRTFLKRLQEKRKKAEEKQEKKGEVSDCVHLEAVHVRRVYRQIAPHIQDLKQKTWPRVKDFLKSLKPGSFVADVGCGNGRYLHINPSIIKMGSDICHPFLLSASSQGFEVLLADNLSLPYRDNIFDAAISVGVIHHFASKERRVQALQELARIVCPGGLLMVYVWAFEQKHRKFDSQDILVPWHEPRKSDQGHRKTRVSSLPDLDRLSTSSTGSSLSDEDFSVCPCRQLNLHTEAGSCHQSACTESLREPKQQRGPKDQFPEQPAQVHIGENDHNGHSLSEKTRCSENKACQNHSDHELAQAEALIRECQKVESYLSSLCRHTLGRSLSEKSKSLSSMPSSHSPLGSFEEVILNDTEKSSPSCQSLSLQDDDVFLDKTDCPVLGSSGSFHRSSPKKSLSEECVLDDSLINHHLLSSFDNQEVRNDSPFGTVHHMSSVLTGSIDSLDSSASSRDIGFLEGRPAHIEVARSKLSHYMEPEESELRGDSLQKQHIEDQHLSVDEDFCLVDIGADLSMHTSATICDKKESSPRSMLNTLKQGLRNIFRKTKAENGRHTTACFVPCVTPSFPQEHFQVREFPQSSLPAGTMLDRDALHSLGNHVSVLKEPASTYSFKEDENGDDVSQNVLKCRPGCQQDDSISQNSIVFEETQSDLNLTIMSEKSRNFDCIGQAQPVVKESMLDASIRYDCHAESRSCKPGMAKRNTGTHRRKPFAKARSSSSPAKGDSINRDLCRFYHVFREGELESLVTQHLPGVVILYSVYDHANWCLILQKL